MDTNTMLVADYLDAVRLRGRSPKTVTTYGHSLGRYLAYLGDRDLREATPRVIRGFLSSELEAGTAPTSIVREHGDVRTFYKWLVREDEIQVSPVDRVPAPVAPLPPVATVPSDGLRKLLEVRGRGRFADHRNRFIILLLTDTGVRARELLGIRVSDVNLTAGTITVNGKTGPRTIGFGSRTATELRRYLRVRAEHQHSELPALLISQRGEMTYTPLWDMLRRYAKLAGVPHVHPHRFRHTWATEQLGSGAGELVVAAAGGWSSTTHMRRYVREATARRAAELNRQNSVADNL